MPPRASVELDEVLQQVGHFGAYQVRLYCLILAPIVFNAIYNTQHVFTAANVEYRCLVPECESSAQWATGAWAQWALVSGSRCERRAPLSSSARCEPASFGHGTQRCTAWVYRNNKTIVAEFDLACQDWKRTLVGLVHSVGVFVALIYIGALSDSIGRRKSFILTATSSAAAGLARSFASSFPTLLALEFLDAGLGAGVYTTGFILVLEMVGVKQRVCWGGIIASAFALGQVLLALVAWLVPYWRTLTQVLYAPSFLFVFYCLFLDESFRWLLSKRKPKDAIIVLRKVAAFNKRALSDATVKRLTTEWTAEQANAQTAVKEKSILCQVVRSRLLMTWMAVCSYCWVTAAFVYYGLSVNAVSLAGNMHLNFALVSLVEIPGYALSVLALDRFGRKRTMMTAYFVCAVALVALPYIPTGKEGSTAGEKWQVALAMVGKLCVSAAFNGLYVLTSELFPTAARHRALGACSLVARLGQILAMLTPLAMAKTPRLPFLVFGGMAGAAALLLLLTPETLHAALPDTVAQAERLSDTPAPRAPPGPPASPRPSPALTVEPHASPIMVDRFSRRLLAESALNPKS